jgi:hypothetical protein
MKTILLVLFYLSFMNFAFPQKKLSRERNHAVTFAPAIFPLSNIGLQAGFQFKVGEDFALLSEVAIPVSKTKGGEYGKTSFYKFDSELKYYLTSFPDRLISLQIARTGREFYDLDSGSYHPKNTQNLIGYGRLHIKSPVFFTDVKFGREMMWNKMFLDTFLGFGIRVSHTKYYPEGAYTIGVWQPARDNYGWFAPTPSWKYDKTVVRPHLALGFRVGWRF